MLDYGVSRQKALFEKCYGLRFKLTEGKNIYECEGPDDGLLLLYCNRQSHQF